MTSDVDMVPERDDGAEEASNSVDNERQPSNWLADFGISTDLGPEARQTRLKEMVDELIRPYSLDRNMSAQANPSGSGTIVATNPSPPTSVVPVSKGTTAVPYSAPISHQAILAANSNGPGMGMGFNNCWNWSATLPIRPGVPGQWLQGAALGTAAWPQGGNWMHGPNMGYPGSGPGSTTGTGTGTGYKGTPPWGMSLTQPLGSWSCQGPPPGGLPNTVRPASGPSHGTIGNPQPNHTISPALSRRGILLLSLDTASLSHQEALFYFGALLTVEGVQPHFQYLEYHGRRWKVKLTFGTFVIAKETVYETKFEARADACREALELLKSSFGNRTVPALPGEGTKVDNMWIWSKLLQAHCDLYKLGVPKYTQYKLGDHFRYEVEVAGSQYFSVGKSYSTVTQAVHASAHRALYSLLLGTVDSAMLFPGVSMMAATAATESSQSLMMQNALNAMQEAQCKSVGGQDATSTDISSGQKTEKKPTAKTHDTATAKPTGNRSRSRKGARVRKNKRRRTLAKDPNPPVTKPAVAQKPAKPSRQANAGDDGKENLERPNANLLAIAPSRLRFHRPPSTPSSPSPLEPKLSLLQAEQACEGVKGNIQRVQVVRHLMNIESPTYHVSTIHDHQGAQCFEAQARFLSDPYLRRAGVVGRAKVAGGTPDMAIEACAGKVLEYLMKMINEQREEESQPGVQRPVVESVQTWREKTAAARAAAASCSKAASALTAPSDGLAIRGLSTSSSNGSHSDIGRTVVDTTSGRVAPPTPFPPQNSLSGRTFQSGAESK